MQKVTSLILQIAMVTGALYYRLNVARANLSGAQEQSSANVTRALELLKQARTALGGEDALKSLESLSISGTARRTFQDQNGQTQERSGKLRLHLAMSDKAASKVAMKLPPPPEGAAHDGRVVIIRRAPGQEGSGAGDQTPGAVEGGPPRKRVMRFGGPGSPMGPPPMGMAPIHLFITTALGAPAPFPIEYSYAGETESGADIVEAKYPGGFVVRLSLDKQTHLPLGMSYRTLMPPPVGAGNVIFFRNRIGKDGGTEGTVMAAPEAGHDEIPDVLIERSEIEEDGVVVEGKPQPEKFQIPLPPPHETEAQVSFSDFRVVDGILLPHRITQNFDGKATETWEVEKYEINSPSGLEKLKQ